MPSYRGHIAGGMITYLTILQCIKYTNPNVHVIIQGLIFCLLGSLFPDVDVKSKGQKIFYTLLLLALLYCLFVYRWDLFIVLSLLGTVPLLVRHRGIFHQIWFLFCLTALIVLITRSRYGQYQNIFLSNGFFFFMGSLSHVLLDCFLTRLKRYLR